MDSTVEKRLTLSYRATLNARAAHTPNALHPGKRRCVEMGVWARGWAGARTI